MVGEPFPDFGMFVGGVVVQDGMDDFACWNGALDLIKKADELLVTVPLHLQLNLSRGRYPKIKYAKNFVRYRY